MDNCWDRSRCGECEMHLTRVQGSGEGTVGEATAGRQGEQGGGIRGWCSLAAGTDCLTSLLVDACSHNNAASESIPTHTIGCACACDGGGIKFCFYVRKNEIRLARKLDLTADVCQEILRNLLLSTVNFLNVAGTVGFSMTILFMYHWSLDCH